MHWKLKARMQRVVSLLPSDASYATYYWLQRRFGALRVTSPIGRLTAGIQTWERIKKLGWDPTGKTFLEIGTGRAPIVPLAYWLMGAEGVITIDVNPYLKSDLIKESLRYITDHRNDIERLFGAALITERLNVLIQFHKGLQFTTDDFLKLCGITYIAPGDAAQTRLMDRSVDFHTSYTVLEHIPLPVLEKIFEEGNRIITDNGLFIHMIDYSDHFAHSDSSISPINFLQYCNAEWERYAGNRYMYMNRLRHDDFMALVESAGHRMLSTETIVDQRVAELIRCGKLRLDDRFKNKPDDILSITEAWLVSQKLSSLS